MKKLLLGLRFISTLSFITTVSFYSFAETAGTKDASSEEVTPSSSVANVAVDGSSPSQDESSNQNQSSRQNVTQSGVVVVVQASTQVGSTSQNSSQIGSDTSDDKNSDDTNTDGTNTDSTVSQTDSKQIPDSTANATSSQAMGLDLLQDMYQATKSLNYELSYIQVRQGKIEPLIYRHAVDGNFTMAHSLYLTGPLREVIRLDDVITYIDPSIEPFSIRSNNMVAPINPLLNTDIEHISTMYDFVPLGRAREAGMACQVVRIVPKDGLRYSYVVWIDEKTKLPLRADLIDRNGDVLEQYRTVSFTVDDRILSAMQSLKNVKLPEVLNFPIAKEKQTDWQVGWVPQGFSNSGVSRYRIPTTDTLVENRLYSDGLFEFSVYVSDKNEKNTSAELYRQGRRILHTFIQNKKEISVVGDIPPVTAKKIIESIRFSSESSG